MSPSEFIVDVTESNFEYEVIAFSQNTPVVVDFWATWCQPCKQLTPMLEALAQEAGGYFRLARVDVDANPNLALRFGVRSVPTVKAFTQGQVVGEFAGMQPETRVREFLSRLTPPSESALALEKAEGLLAEQQWSAAEQVFRALDAETPAQPAVQLGLIKSLIAQGVAKEPAFLARNFPAGKEYQTVELLMPLIEAMTKFERDELPDETDLDAMFRNSIRLALRGNHAAALDGLLGVLRQDKRYRSGKARQVFLGIVDLYPMEHSLARDYRSELASVLF